MLKYAAAALPIVASCEGRIGEVFRHGESAWLIRPGDIEGLAEALCKLANNPSLRQRLGQSARAAVAENYSLQQTARSVVSLCKSAVDSHADEVNGSNGD